MRSFCRFSCLERAMHYHLLLTNEHGDYADIRTLDTAAEADDHARRILTANPEWSPARYPGRSWKRGEIAVFLDRATGTRRELALLRCSAPNGARDPNCLLRRLGIPALNLNQAPSGLGPEAPTVVDTPPYDQPALSRRR